MFQKAFEVGNSTVITIPKGAGIKPGTRLKFTHHTDKLIYEIIDGGKGKIKNDQIRKTSGAFKLFVPNLKEVLKNLEENPYDHEIRVS